MEITPLFFKLESNLNLMIIPDTIAHLDGRPILSYIYSIYPDRAKNNPAQIGNKESALHLVDKNTDPDHYGYIAFEKPGAAVNLHPRAAHLKPYRGRGAY